MRGEAWHVEGGVRAGRGGEDGAASLGPGRPTRSRGPAAGRLDGGARRHLPCQRHGAAFPAARREPRSRARGLGVRPCVAAAARPFLAADPPRTSRGAGVGADRSEEHTSELQSLMRTSYAVFCLKKKNKKRTNKQ